LAERLTFLTADVSIATNESYRRIAIERGSMAPERVFVVRSAPTAESVAESRPDDRWKNNRTHLVGYVGVIGQSEGLDLLLASIDEIVRRRARTDIQFLIVGGGPEWKAIVELSKEMKLEDWVTFTGRVDNRTLFEILATADVCVNPDRATTMNDISTMNKVMEYMALGKPIVQFEATEGRYSAQDASLYAKANDPSDFATKILELIDDPQARVRMGDFGRRRFREVLAWNHQAPILLRAYDAIFSLGRKVTPR
jgi:glycosyltransferase involved in cell wall biosynthesis